MLGRSLKWFLVIMMMFSGGTMAHATYCRVVCSDSAASLEGKASWYSQKSPGVRKTTANMEKFDDSAMTCAMWDVPFNQQLRVTNLKNGKSVVVRVNDRGPHKRYVRKGRVVDLSKGAFHKIADLNDGLIEVRVEFL